MATHSVLVIDGDAGARERLVDDLARAGYSASAFGGLNAAREVVCSGSFVCAIVDVAADEGSGLDIVPRLRQIAPNLPVIVTASENSRALEAAVRELNVLYYHVKGFDTEELLEAVREAAGGVRRPTMKKILVIDDDPDYQDAVRMMLEAAGYEVVSAYSKEEGSELVAAAKPDLIILDIMMDRLSDGFQFLYEMREDPTAKSIPVLSVTAVSEKTGFNFRPTTDGDYFPADDFLAKPVKAEELVSRVEALLGRSS